MAGRVGRNRAWNKLTVAQHQRRGTYRPDRHGPQAVLQAWPAAASETPGWRPSPEELGSLQEAGRTFVTRIVEQYRLDLTQGLLLLEAARALDALTNWRREASPDKSRARLILAHQKQFVSLLGRLGLE